MSKIQKIKLKIEEHFRKKKQEKVLKTIRKKRTELETLKRKIRFEQSYENRRNIQNKINSLMEEIIKMGKYVLKDGKMVLKNENEQVTQNIEQPMPYENQAPAQVPQPPMPQQVQEQVPMTEEELLRYQQIQAQVPQPPMPQQVPQPPMPQQVPQPPMPQQVPQEVLIQLVLSNGEVLDLPIPETEISAFIQMLNERIINRTTIELNIGNQTRVLSGAHIVSYLL